MGKLKNRESCGECTWKNECPFNSIPECTLGKIKQMLKDIPLGSNYQANRYDTDDEHVLCVWVDDVTFDIRFEKSYKKPKKENDECPGCGEKSVDLKESEPVCDLCGWAV